MTKTNTIKKQEVELEEKPKSPQQQAQEALDKMLNRNVEAPDITDTIDKAKQALKLAQRAKHMPLRQTWYCTDCGQPHIQNDGPGMLGGTHISVDCTDGEFTLPNGDPLPASHMALMTEYAVPKVEGGESECFTANYATLAKMKEIKSTKL